MFFIFFLSSYKNHSLALILIRKKQRFNLFFIFVTSPHFLFRKGAGQEAFATWRLCFLPFPFIVV